MRELNEKAEKFQVYALRDNVQKHMDQLRNKLDFMTEICGEARTTDNEKVTRLELPCISCNTPARGAMGEPNFLGPRPPTLGSDKDDCASFLEKGKEGKKVEEEKEKEGGAGDQVRKVCYKFEPIPHQIHPRARICAKICGGPAPKLDVDESEDISSTITVQAIRKDKGPVPKIIKPQKVIPCIPCNQLEKGFAIPKAPAPYQSVNKAKAPSDVNLLEQEDMKVEDVSDEDYRGSLNEHAAEVEYDDVEEND
ncbi:uncharacterized protein LOC126367183 [Pectinophora gossypiella]|uniref:uncharacterized protein LOC126367183 n=1 Tax=Pectinophora gossypiella TaxID=13191 RepID=UPI00214EAD58|nr:uncharacterized protein LOC126367183 [Pectinophora gossypiella]